MDTEKTEMVKVQLLAPKREIDELCANVLTDVRTQAVMIAVRTYNRQHGEAGRGAEDPGGVPPSPLAGARSVGGTERAGRGDEPQGKEEVA